MRDFLERFRPAGAPGAATAAGVPSDHRDQLAAELEPIFAALADTQAECDRLRRASVAVAARREAEASERARALVAHARTDAEAERAAAAARLRDEGVRTAAQIKAGAEAEAAQIRQRDERSRERLVARVLDRIRVDLATLGPGRDASARGPGNDHGAR